MLRTELTHSPNKNPTKKYTNGSNEVNLCQGGAIMSLLDNGSMIPNQGPLLVDRYKSSKCYGNQNCHMQIKL